MSVKIALAGNPNCGKTTLFNALTGSNQFVGNWPGVTVEKKDGRLKDTFGSREAVIIDLPGIYSLSPYTLEEVVARDYLTGQRPDAVLNIVDGTNLERNLYLSTQLLELGIPLVMAVNMADVLEKSGVKIHTEKLSQKLGCPVIKISALKGTGVDEAVRKAVSAAVEKKSTAPVHIFDAAIESAIETVTEKLEGAVPEEQKRFYGIKLLERDPKISTQFANVPEVEAEAAKLEKAYEDDMESIITNARYEYIASVMEDCCTRKSKGGLSISDRIDRVVTNRWAALPLFAAVMVLVYYISISTVGTWVTDWANDGLFGEGFHFLGISGTYDKDTAAYAREKIWTREVRAAIDGAADAGVPGSEELLRALGEEDLGGFAEAYGTYGASLEKAGFDISHMVDAALEGAPDPAAYGLWVPGIPVLAAEGLEKADCAPWLQSLIVEGIIGGVGAVLGFVPQMLVLFGFLAFLEACGYMARVAFIMDRIFRRFGLSGKSFIPMLIGSGCGVPGIMASRTIESDRDRKMTIMTTTFIPCGAKMPIIALIAAALFDNAWWLAPSAYFIGVAAIICSGILLKKTKMFAGDPAPFVMELPAYHWPTVGNVLRSMWERGWSFIRKAGTIILLSSMVIWVGSRFGAVDGRLLFDGEMELEDSVLGIVGGALSWIFAPLGFGSIRATIATIMGLVAKEEVVGVFGVLDFEGMSRLAAYSFLVFNLLCAPCFAAMGAIRREMNHAKWFWFAIGYQCGLAYVASLCIYQIGMLFTGAFGIGTIIAFLLLAGFLYLLCRPGRESAEL